MKSILFVAHDPGGANVIKPVIEHFAAKNNIKTHLLLLGPAAERIKPQSLTAQYHSVRTIQTPDFPNELSAEPDDIAASLDAVKPDAVFTATSFNSNLERLAVRYARKRAIPTFSILDFWSNYRKRFMLEGIFAAPDILLVTDERMKREAETELPETRVIVSGNPHLAGISEKYRELRKQAASKAENSEKRIRFFCENIRHYYPHKPINEFTVVPKLLQGLYQCGFQGNLIVRPHPMESREPWQELIARYENDVDSAEAIRFKLDTATFDEVLQDECIAVGFSSMALLETASVGIPTYSYQIAVPPDYFWLPFEEYGITRLTNESAIAALVSSIHNKPLHKILEMFSQSTTNIGASALEKTLTSIDAVLQEIFERNS